MRVEAGQLQEQFVQVLADGLVASEQAVVGVAARGTRVIVAGAEMAVAAQPAAFPAHDHRDLGVGLEPDDAVHHVRAGFLQPVAKLDVCLFVEARRNSMMTVTSLPALRGVDQRVDDRRFGPVRYSVCLIASTRGSAAAPRRKSRPAPNDLERVVQQHVFLADDGKQVVDPATRRGTPGVKIGYLRSGRCDQVVDRHRDD